MNRQAERYAREGMPISFSTLADQVGAACHVLDPLLKRIEAHVMSAERLHGDDAIVPVLAKGKTETGRCWTYVRDDRPFGAPSRRRRCSTFPRDRKASTPTLTWPPGPVSCKPTPTAATNTSAERALRGLALGCKAWLFAGSERGGKRAAAMYSLIVTAKLYDVDPHAWLADVLARIAEHYAQRLDELLPWNWNSRVPAESA